MGAPGLPGLVGQMGRKVPGPIWVLNGLSPVCLPSWFHSHVTRPCSERSSDCTVQGVHIRCVLTSLPTTSTTHTAISRLPDPTSRASPSVPRWWIRLLYTHWACELSYIYPSFSWRYCESDSAGVMQSLSIYLYAGQAFTCETKPTVIDQLHCTQALVWQIAIKVVLIVEAMFSQTFVAFKVSIMRQAWVCPTREWK